MNLSEFNEGQLITTLDAYNDGLQALYEANEGYYSGKPVMPDDKYDRLVRQLKAFQEDHPELKLEDPLFIGAYAVDVPTELDTTGAIWHATPMLSLLDVFEPIGVSEWVVKMIKNGASTILCEPKIDGLSVKARYVGGELESLSTRGNGMVGTNITDCAGFIKGIPDKISTTLAVVECRGEAYISDQDFKVVGQGFANSRNLVAGTIGAHDPTLCEQRKVRAIFYDVIGLSIGDTHLQDIQFMLDNDMPVVQSMPISLPSEFGAGAFSIAQLEDVANKAREYGLPIDGVVLKVNEHEIAQKLGFTAHHPRAAIAYKFAEQHATVEVKTIEWGVGKGGRLTPVAIFEPVFISGSLVSRVTCHNATYLREKGIGIGAVITVFKSGGVIPKVGKVERAVTPYIISMCPECHSKLFVGSCSNGAEPACPNPDCPGILAARLEHFCSPKAMRINGIGGIVARQLVNMGKIVTGPALMLATEEELLEAGLTRVRAAGVRKAVQVMCTRPDRFGRYIFALGIPSVGIKRAWGMAEIASHWNGELPKPELFMPFEEEWLDIQYGSKWWYGVRLLQGL